MCDSKRDGYTLVFHENEGVEIFELVAVGARVYLNTSDGVYRVDGVMARKSSLSEAVNGDTDSFDMLIDTVRRSKLEPLNDH